MPAQRKNKNKSSVNKNIFTSRSLLVLLLLLFIVGIFYFVYIKIGKFSNIETDVNVVTPYGSCPSPYESKWGEWCVYTYTDAYPDRLIWGFDNIYHPSPNFRNGKWTMFVGGWQSASAQGWSDKIFRLETSDRYGITGWTLIKNPANNSPYYMNNDFENTSSMDMPAEIKPNAGSGNPYKAKHVIQPSYFPYDKLPGGQSCCDTVFYSYDVLGTNPAEKYTVINWFYIDGRGYPQKAGVFGAKNPVMSYKDYWNAGTSSVQATSDAHVTYDPKTKAFYMFYGEWRNISSTFTNLTIGVARAGWTNQKFSIVKQDVLGNASGGPKANPHVVVGPDGKYYLFYTKFNTTENEIHVAYSDTITGPYVGDKIALVPPSNDGYTTHVGTPYVVCNTANNRWQMYFSFNTEKLYDNQLYTAFLEKNCSQAPY